MMKLAANPSALLKRQQDLMAWFVLALPLPGLPCFFACKPPPSFLPICLSVRLLACLPACLPACAGLFAWHVQQIEAGKTGKLI